jgi:hypothetical protein
MWKYQVALMVAAVLIVHPVHAAQVYLVSPESSVSVHDTFYVPIRIDTQGECINTVDVAVLYDPSVVSVRDVATGNSIITLWAERPEIERDLNGRESGRVSFSGGVPGGYCGRVLGDAGLTNTLAELVVTGSATRGGVGTTTRMFLDPATVLYRNDGAATVVDRTLLGIELAMETSTTSPDDQWLRDVQSDTVAPEFFDIRLVQGPSVGSPYHYIVFSTTDKQSGVDHYQVLETDPDRFGILTWVQRESRWVTVESPYILRDQKLHSKILVKAVDKNGNERIAEYTPPMSPLVQFTRPVVLVPALLFMLLVAVILALVVRMVRMRRQLEQHRNEISYEQHE